MSEKLKEIRQKIDTLDDKIHDVLMDRAALIVDVAEEKRKHNMQFVQPAREAKMIRRLLGRHSGPLPEAAIVRIWRELVGAVSLLQTGLNISVVEAEGPQGLALWEMARNYFGSAVPVQSLSNPRLAIASVREKQSSFAVLPWPPCDESDPWWGHLFSQEEPVNIVCALPYGAAPAENSANYYRALVISGIDFMPSGEDRSFIGMQLNQNISRARIVDVFKSLNLAPRELHTQPQAQGRYSLHCIEVDAYVKKNDHRLRKARVQFDEAESRLKVLGGYPVPPVFQNGVKRV